MDLVTPRENVLRLTRTTAPPRDAGVLLMIVGAGSGAIGGWLVGTDVHDRGDPSRNTALAIGTTVLAVGATMLGFGTWMTVVPARRDALLGPSSTAPP